MTTKLQLLIITFLMTCQLNAQFQELSYPLDQFEGYNHLSHDVDSDYNVIIASYNNNQGKLGVSKVNLKGQEKWFTEINITDGTTHDYQWIQVVTNPLDSTVCIGLSNKVLILDNNGNLLNTIQFPFPDEDQNQHKNFIINNNGEIIYWYEYGDYILNPDNKDFYRKFYSYNINGNS